MTNIEILERVIKLMPLASKDETRSHLCGVHLAAGETVSAVIIEVTDGHRLIRENYILGVDSSFAASLHGLEKGILIERDQLATLKRIYKDNKNFDVQISILDHNTVMEVKGFMGTNAFPVRHLPTYPDTDQLIPKRGTHCVSFNAQYLLDIAKAISNPKSMAVKVWFDINMVDPDASPNSTQIPVVDNVKPLIITGTIDEKEREAVLMPMRI